MGIACISKACTRLQGFWGTFGYFRHLRLYLSSVLDVDWFMILGCWSILLEVLACLCCGDLQELDS